LHTALHTGYQVTIAYLCYSDMSTAFNDMIDGIPYTWTIIIIIIIIIIILYTHH